MTVDRVSKRLLKRDFLENVMYRRQYQYRTVALQYLYHTLVQFWTFFKKISRTRYDTDGVNYDKKKTGFSSA